MSLSQIEFLQHILDECLYLLKESHTNTFEEFTPYYPLARHE
jgi:hypothetical protein